MSNRFCCPHCTATLNPGTKVILRASHDNKTGLILLSPQVGNYTTILPDELPLQKGDQLSITCPVCSEDLTSPSNQALGEVVQKDPEGLNLRVNFSRTYGEHATFIIAADQVQSFGEDAGQYGHVNFFGEGRGKE